MKKAGIIAMAMVLLAAFSQCKKENTPTPANGGETVNITLNVNGGGTRVSVNTENGEVTFEENDVLYVASGGVYVGTLTYNGSVFSGDITEPTEGQKLHFYFLGNVDTEETLTEGTSTGCSVVISDQRTKLPVISYAPSRENYETGRTAYNATLLNKCALVKFNVITSSTAATCVKGMNNLVTVDFAENTITNGKIGKGIVTLPAGSGEKWAILLPQDVMEAGEIGSAYSIDGEYRGTRDAMPAIENNDYLTDGISVVVDFETIIPQGALKGWFTVNANGDQVYFSQGNLQYIGSASTPFWKFAENQWDIFGTATGQCSTNQDVDRDLFGWGTSGYNHGAFYYQPWSTYGGSGYGYDVYGQYIYNLYDQTGQADWGYNAIINGGNQENIGWRTLTKAEWGYLFNNRTNAAWKKGHGRVNGKNGMILLPDNWTLPEGLSFIPGYSQWKNVYDATQWELMEANGAVFLPTAGIRWGASQLVSAGTYGFYWSSTHLASSNPRAFNLCFSFNNIVHPQGDQPRCNGLSVRLVRDVE